MEGRFILVIDEGTTSTRVNIFDSAGQVVASCGKEFAQRFPKPGWVEHDPEEIWEATLECMRGALGSSGIDPAGIAAIGVTNQRETTVMWDKDTGRPVYNAIVWQCRRSAPICDEIKAQGYADEIYRRTGLVVDAYFSGTKIKWILDNVPGVRDAAREGKVKFGTIDSWLIWKLTGGRVHATDHTNASRTLLFNIRSLKWDEDILKLLDIPASVLPEVKMSTDDYGITKGLGVLPDGIPIAGVAGDQQAALFGQLCLESGSAKNTYGTGCFMLMNTGSRLVESKNGLLATIGISTREGVSYALEGSIFIAGAAVQWLRDALGIIAKSAETEEIALSVPDNGGVYFVPAFVGLGAPHWDMYARGILVGLTRGTGKAHIVRAVLESIAYQTLDILSAMERDSGIRLRELRVDGGAVANNFLMQFQADILGVKVIRPRLTETTSAGAAYLAGLQVGLWGSADELRGLVDVDRIFLPEMAAEARRAVLRGWAEAVKCSLGWERKREAKEA